MASIAGEQEIFTNNQTVETNQKERDSREGSVEKRAAAAAIRDRDEKLKLAKERQNEERQRKIEELKAQAEAAQRYREQKEEERRRRIEEIRMRDNEKRHQVEERKRAIMEAEKERREYILRKNQERESRLESKKRERSSIAFAFGSSTPRLLEPADFGMVSPSTFWGQRRSTSISNVAGVSSLSRRSSERELNDSGAKKRATSASGTDRRDEDNIDATSSSQIVFRSVARRKTDLMPTIPTPRDGHHYGSRSSLSNTPRTPGSRSGNVTPGGNSRPGSAMSTSTTLSTAATRRSAPIRKPRPASIAGTVVSLDEINKLKRESKPPLKTSSAHAHPTTSAQTTPKRSGNLMSTSMIVTSTSSSLSNSTADKRLPSSAKREQKSNLSSKTLPKTSSSDRLNKLNKAAAAKEPAIPLSPQLTSMTKSAIVTTSTSSPASTANQKIAKSKSEKKPPNVINPEMEQESPKASAIVVTESVSTIVDIPAAETTAAIDQETSNITEIVESNVIAEKTQLIEVIEKQDTEKKEVKVENDVSSVENPDTSEPFSTLAVPQNENNNGNDAMTASMIARNKITTEEEAKAALAERRRLMREEAERQAELERQRIEAERFAEIRRQEEEAERQRQFEEESLRLAEEQRRAEEERLRQAIEEAKQREEEDRRKREEEERQRIEREEIEKKAKEEAEKQRIEVAERLKREEKEREERRKRVEAIMSRTRKGGAATNTPNSTPSKDVNASNVGNAQSQQEQEQSLQQSAPPTSTPSSGESNSPSASSTTTSATTPIQQQEQQQVSSTVVPVENTQAVYEQSVIDKENALLNSFNNMIIDENAKNLLQQQQHQHQIEVTNGKLLANFPNTDAILQNLTTTTAAVVANGNGHIENINNKNDINILQDVIAPTTAETTNQLIDFNVESQDINNVHFNNNNNNSLLAATATTANTLVNIDSHENTDISLL